MHPPWTIKLQNVGDAHNISDCSHGFIHLHGMYNQKQMSLSVMYLSIQQLWLLVYSRDPCNILSSEHSCWTSRRHNSEILEFENHFYILTSVSRSFERLLIPVETKNGVTFQLNWDRKRESHSAIQMTSWMMSNGICHRLAVGDFWMWPIPNCVQLFLWTNQIPKEKSLGSMYKYLFFQTSWDQHDC